MNEKWMQQYKEIFDLMKTLPKWQGKTDADFRTWLSSEMLTGTQIAALQGVDEETPRRWRKNGLKIGETESGVPILVYLEAINGEGIRGKPVIHTKAAVKRFLQESGVKPTTDLEWVLNYNELNYNENVDNHHNKTSSGLSAVESVRLAAEDADRRRRSLELQLKQIELEKRRIELEMEKTKLELELEQLRR